MNRPEALVERVPQKALRALGLAASHRIVLLFDGDCPLCAREVAWLASLRRADAVLFVDIAAADFDAASLGLDPDDLMGEIHALMADGEVVIGMEVFRRVYAALGLGWITALTSLPGLRSLSDAAYRFFAKHRLRR